jgi:hypothetical protein
MPGLESWLTSNPQPVPDKPEKKSLWPPSALGVGGRSSICQEGLAALEAEMREVHALEKLEELRHHLRARSASNHFKKTNLVGQHAQTRSHEVLSTIERKVQLAADHYRLSYQALVALDPPGKWRSQIRPLLSTDVVGLDERLVSEHERRTLEKICRQLRLAGGQSDSPIISNTVISIGEGHRVLSWIWHNVSVQEVEDDVSGKLHESVRVEWSKCRARCHRWREEVQLLDEEMRRVLDYSQWKSQWWAEQIKDILPTEELMEGLVAYALEHHAHEQALRTKLKKNWIPYASKLGMFSGTINNLSKETRPIVINQKWMARTVEGCISKMKILIGMLKILWT